MTQQTTVKIELRTGGVVLRELEEPSMVITQQGAVLYLGESDEAESFLINAKSASKAGYGYLHMSQGLFLVTIPKNQAEVDRVFNSTGYARKYVPKESALVS